MKYREDQAGPDDLSRNAELARGADPRDTRIADLDRKASAVRDALDHGGLGGLSWHELSAESQERYRDVVRYAEGGQGVSTGEVIATRRIAELEQQVARKAEQVDQIIRDQMEENEAQMQEIAELEAEVAWLRAKPSPEKMARRVLDGEPALTKEELALYADFKEPDEDTEESPTPPAPEAREKPPEAEEPALLKQLREEVQLADKRRGAFHHMWHLRYDEVVRLLAFIDGRKGG